MQRLTVSLLLVVLSAVVGLGWGIDQWYSAQVTEAEDPVLDAYKTMGRELAKLIDHRPAAATSVSQFNDWREYSVLQPQLVDYINFPLPQGMQQQFVTGEPLVLDSGVHLSLHFYLPAQAKVLSLTLPEELRQDNQNSLRWLLTLLFYTGVILVVLIWLYPLLRRLALLRATAQSFGAGDLNVRIAADKHSYIHTIEQDFNRMAQRIEQLIADNKLLSRGLSHDLRTPLARLRFGVEVLQESELNEAQQKNIAHLTRDLNAMEALVEALLHYARLEQNGIALALQPTPLAGLLSQLHEHIYAEQVVLDIAPEVRERLVNVDPEYITMLLHNVLQNALRYGGEIVHLRLFQDAGGVRLAVEDNGPGIIPAERHNVLKPFYRSATGASYRGHGLGLAIVERIAQWHGAELLLGESAQLGGLAVVVTFADN